MTISAYAIARHGLILVDTVRAEEHDARQAAIQGLHQSGVRWTELVRRGYAVVRVSVKVHAPLAAPRQQAVEEEAPPPEPADRRPVRRYLCALSNTPAWVRAQARHQAKGDHR